MKLTKSHYINGKWVSGKGTPFLSINPANEKMIWKGSEGTTKDVDDAVNAAKQAFRTWSCLSLIERIASLRAFGQVLLQHKEALTLAISQETGKPLWDSASEVTAMINKIGISIDAYAVRCPEIVTKQPNGTSICRHRPQGVLSVLGPYNFPCHLPNGHIIPALLAGNTIVFKPSELTPLSAELMVQCWHESKLPAGVINLVQGGKQTGKSLSSHPGIDGLLFTGSWQTGSALARQFAEYPYKMLALEMGGNNPLVVGAISDTQAAAYLTIQSAFITSGQRCTSARRLIIPKGKIGDLFLKELIVMTKLIKVGAYNDTQEPFMGPVISIATSKTLIETQQDLLNLGGKPLLSMSRLTRSPAFLTPGIIDMTAVKKRPDIEIFGPLLQVIRVKNFDAAIQEANQTQYGLSAGLFSDSQDESNTFYREIKAGIINLNAPLTGASSAMPFGGIGKSGNHRPSAFYAADYTSYPVASLENKTLITPKTLMPGIALCHTK